ncbi:MAG TPA: GNAT family N-acetyltransferase [Methanomassiliicoccales archaeon]
MNKVAGEKADEGRIIPIADPSENEISQILALKEKCEMRMGVGILLTGDFLRSLDKPGVGALAFVREARCIGFSFFYSFEKEEAEVSIFADPDEDWMVVCSMLLDATTAECKRRGHFRILVMNDRRLNVGVDLIKGVGGKLAFSEHRMSSTGSQMVPTQQIDLREVGNDDLMLREVELECHDRFYSKPDQRRFLAQVDGRPIGKIDVLDEGSVSELTGFCVLPWSRGKGFGRSILRNMVNMLRAEGKGRIILDVQTDNDVALSLYLKSGFEKEFTIDYYAISLKEMVTVEGRGREPWP